MYTHEDLADAKGALESLEARSDNYSGNNPDKYCAAIADARVRVHYIEQHLKGTGQPAKSAQELLEARLDSAFPAAQSKQVVVGEGKRYMRRFAPVAKSLSGKTVKAWCKCWQPMPDDQP